MRQKHGAKNKKAIKMKGLIECVAFILVKRDSFLVEKRASDKIIDPNIIAIPGGHVEDSEIDEQALMRETTEELGVVPKSYEHLCKLVYRNPVENQIVQYFVVKKWSGKIKANEAEKLFWIKLKDYKKLDLECDRKAIKKYLKKKEKHFQT